MWQPFTAVVVFPVPVEVGANAPISEIRAGLAPEAFLFPGVLVAVGVGAGSDEEVQVVRVLGPPIVVLHQLADSVQGHGGCDPLTCVNACNQGSSSPPPESAPPTPPETPVESFDLLQ